MCQTATNARKNYLISEADLTSISCNAIVNVNLTSHAVVDVNLNVDGGSYKDDQVVKDDGDKD